MLSPRTRGIIGAKEFALMKPTAYLVNTAAGRSSTRRRCSTRCATSGSRAPASTSSTWSRCRVDHPLRKLDNVVLSPHLGYVTQENFRGSYGGVVEDIRAFLDGKPIRLLEAAETI